MATTFTWHGHNRGIWYRDLFVQKILHRKYQVEVDSYRNYIASDVFVGIELLHFASLGGVLNDSRHRTMTVGMHNSVHGVYVVFEYPSYFLAFNKLKRVDRL